MMYARPDGDHRAYLHRLKMLYQCIQPNSYIVMAYSSAHNHERKLIGILAATHTFRDFSNNMHV